MHHLAKPLHSVLYKPSLWNIRDTRLDPLFGRNHIEEPRLVEAIEVLNALRATMSLLKIVVGLAGLGSTRDVTDKPWIHHSAWILLNRLKAPLT
jgi:hypothetical protein